MAKAATSKAPATQGTVTPKAQAAQPNEANRRYKGTQTIDHDLFKLKLSNMLKDFGYQDYPDMRKVEHVHHFHSVDSSGKAQTHCHAVGGHVHECTVTGFDSEGLPVLKVGPAMKWVRIRKRGVNTKVLVPITVNSDQGEMVDDHTHEAVYLESQAIVKRAPNMEFAKLESAMRAVQEPTVEGVSAG